MIVYVALELLQLSLILLLIAAILDLQIDRRGTRILRIASALLCLEALECGFAWWRSAR